MKLLLTGATGFVGRNLLLRLLKENRYDEIWLPVRSPEKLKEQLAAEGIPELPAHVKVVRAEAPEWKFEFPQVDHVVHGAALLSGVTREEFHKVNVEGTRRLFELLPKAARVVALSSLAAAGPCLEGQAYRIESQPSNPLTWYGESKLAMEEMLAKEFASRDYLCIRPPIVFGARDSASLALFKMAKQLVRFKPGFTPKYYSYVAVGDLVSAILLALEGDWTSLPQRSFFVGADLPVTDAELITESGRALKRSGMILKVPHSVIRGVSRVVDRVPAWRKALPNLSADRVQEIWPDKWVASSEPFKKAFDWKHTQTFPALMQETGDWYVQTKQL